MLHYTIFKPVENVARLCIVEMCVYLKKSWWVNKCFRMNTGRSVDLFLCYSNHIFITKHDLLLWAGAHYAEKEQVRNDREDPDKKSNAHTSSQSCKKARHPRCSIIIMVFPFVRCLYHNNNKKDHVWLPKYSYESQHLIILYFSCFRF